MAAGGVAKGDNAGGYGDAMTGKVGLYGGSFNPIHFGHLISARSVAEQLGLTRVVLIPSASPPHKQRACLAPAADRLEMTRIAVEGDPLFDVSDIELLRTGPSYTLDTVMEMRGRLGLGPEIVWIIGADSLPELATWSRITTLVKSATIVTATRPGWERGRVDLTALRAAVGAADVEMLLANCLETPAVGISASEIRERVRGGRSIRYLVPAGVASYIHKHGLYA